MATETTDTLSLPYIMPSQAQKHVTHNEAIATLDVLVQTVVADETATPPGTPAPGDRLIVAPDPTGAFAGQAKAIAVYRDGSWAFMAPQTGWTAYDRTRERVVVFTGENWEELPPPRALTALDTVGVNAAANAGNRLAVASPASLFTHEGNDHRLKINKAAQADTASLLFQNGYFGRAEMGLTGSDDFAVKVSADGANWVEAMRIDGGSGRLSFPQGVAGFREVLTANRICYVRKTGSDANDGLASGTAFLTVQKAIDAALALDMSIYSVTIDVGPGTFNEGSRLGVTGNGNARITVQGAGYDQTAISGSGYGISASGGVSLTVRDVDVVGNQICITAGLGAVIYLAGTVQISGGAARLIQATSGATIQIAGAHTIRLNSDSAYLLYADQGGYMIIAAGVTMKTTGARSFSATVKSSGASVITVTASQVAWDTTDGAISGARYSASLNGVINTVTGGGASYFPGSANGSVSTGGQYA